MAQKRNWIIGVLLILKLISAENCRAQGKELPMPFKEYHEAQLIIRDSLLVAERYLANNRFAAAERTATALLKRYPLVPAFEIQESKDVPNIKTRLRPEGFPANAFAVRARAREALGNYRQAEADITLALPGYPARYMSETQQEVLKQTWLLYETRARLRFRHLNNRAGGCADLGVLYQLDSVRAAQLGYGKCAIPRLRFAVRNPDIDTASLAAADSIDLADQALARSQYRKALRIMNNLIAGRVSRYVRFKVYHDAAYQKALRSGYRKPPIPGQLWAMRAQARKGLGDYRGALADLDTALTYVKGRCYFPGDGRWLYQRGLLRMEHFQDKAGGCADLAKAYQCDTTITAPGHLKWRGCPLPAFKKPIGEGEMHDAKLATDKTFSLLEAQLEQNQNEQAIRTATGLLKKQAGRYEDVMPLIRDDKLLIQIHLKRSRAWENLKRYPEAVADLDTAIRIGNRSGGNGWLYVSRGILKLDYMKDPSGCEDLRTAYRHGYSPKDKNWRGCNFEEKNFSNRFSENTLEPLFGGEVVVKPQIGVFYQGKMGVSGSAYLSNGLFIANWGPSLGLDLMGGVESSIPVIAPKLSVEANLGFYAARLDLSYFGYQHRQDLRLTPQAGVTFFGIINLLYGYSFPLRIDKQPFLDRQRLSLYINFVKAEKIGG